MPTNGTPPDKLVTASKFLRETDAGSGRQLSLFRILSHKLGLGDARESLYTGPEAPWSPVPLKDARDWIRADENRRIDFIFPTVFEEDRSTKIKDIATVQGLDFISHQRASEMIAQEMEIDNYDWQKEMEKIEQERKAFGAILPAPGAGASLAPKGGVTIGAPAPGLAGEDDLDADLDDLDDDVDAAGSRPTPVPSEPRADTLGDPDADVTEQPHRAERSGDATRRFKQQQHRR